MRLTIQYRAASTMESNILEMLSRLRRARAEQRWPARWQTPLLKSTTNHKTTWLLLILLCNTKLIEVNLTFEHNRVPSWRKSTLLVHLNFTESKASNTVVYLIMPLLCTSISRSRHIFLLHTYNLQKFFFRNSLWLLQKMR